MQSLSLLFSHKIAKRLALWLLLIILSLLGWCLIHQSITTAIVPIHLSTPEAYSDQSSQSDCHPESAYSIQQHLHICQEPLLQSSPNKLHLAIWVWISLLPLFLSQVQRVQYTHPLKQQPHIGDPPLYLTTARLRH
ncbi:hypothetical protein [Celerinatantimonas sp. YJH-8]|uniref:hypothetical protein n=1 Tax=Celerinatantimonas sp. YJH-8 TaxID=3228714 RepID=UPI0038C52E80